jgi:AbrB family looped-hinge helix DNA binding protein
MRITSKGQITIPKAVRERAGITEATDLDVIYENGKVVVEKVAATDAERQRRAREIKEWIERFRGTADNGLTTDEIMEMTRGPFDDVDPR